MIDRVSTIKVVQDFATTHRMMISDDMGVSQVMGGYPNNWMQKNMEIANNENR